MDTMTASIGNRPPRVLIIVENLPVPFDRRVWSEATTLVNAGYEVSVICPKGKEATASFEVIDGVHIFRHPLPIEARGGVGYLLEYGSALVWEFLLSLKVLYRRGFDVIHACNPPDLIFIIGAFYKYLFRKRFVFDHHDINPELYEAKFGKRDFLWRMMVRLERWTFALADISIATNDSYRKIAIERGGMTPERVYIVRSGPNLARVRSMLVDPCWKNGRPYLVAYVGVIGKQEGLDLLLESIRHIHCVRGRNDIQFAIVGGGPELEATKALAKEMGLDDIVTFTGRVDDVTLFSVLSSADVCVNPDRPNLMNDKSTMNKIMEYMALGKPIVQFDLTEGRFSAQGASLYARNTDTNDFGDKILTLLDDPDLGASMGEFGRKRVRDELSWKHEEPKLLEAYSNLLTRPIHEA
jgi:glycosyltransferase involved in cell wall biosynthesis